ncbi:hypothetical protein D3C80_1677770 [compost metagenome]
MAVFPTDEPELAVQSSSAPDAAFQEAPFPAITALLRFTGTTLAEVLQTRDIHVLMYDPYRFNNVLLADEDVPLAANFTSGYGLWLARSGFSTQALRSLLGVDNGLLRPMIYLM